MVGISTDPVALTSRFTRTTTSNALVNTGFEPIQTTYQIGGSRPIASLTRETVLVAQTVTAAVADTSGATAQAILNQRDQALTTIQNALGQMTNLAKQLSDGDQTGIHAQQFDENGNAVGGEYQINTAVGKSQYGGTVTTLADGGHIVIYTSDDQDGDDAGLFGQRYDSSGNAIGTEFQINTTTVKDQNEASVAALADGGFIVTFTSENQDGDGLGIFAQQFSSLGTKVGGEFQVNSTSANHQSDSSVATLADGSFVVTYTSKDQDGDDLGVFGQRFSVVGTKIGGEFQVNTTTDKKQYDSTVTALHNGGYVVTYTSENQDGNGKGIFGQQFDVFGNKIGGEFQINTVTEDHQTEASVASLGEDGFVVTYTSKDLDGDGEGVFIQRFDGFGNKVGGETQVNTTSAKKQFDASVTALGDEGFVVTYTSENQDGDGMGVYAQRFDENGNKVGGEVLVNSTTDDHQTESSVAVLRDGGYVVTFRTGEQKLSDLTDAELTTIVNDLRTLGASISQVVSDLKTSVDAYAASVDLSAAGANALLSDTADVFSNIDNAFTDFLTTLSSVSSSKLDDRLADVNDDFTTLTGDIDADFDSASPALASVDSSFATLETEAQNTAVIALETTKTVFVEKALSRPDTGPTHVAFGSLGAAGTRFDAPIVRATLAVPSADPGDAATEESGEAGAAPAAPEILSAAELSQRVLDQSGVAQAYSLNRSVVDTLTRNLLDQSV